MNIISMIAALLFGAVSTSVVWAAPVGKPFMKGMVNPSDLANRIEVALVRDPKGVKLLDPDFCKKSGSCASPKDYLEMFQMSDPKAGLMTIAQVPAFLRSLKIEDAPSGEYWLACLKPAGKSYKPVLHCVSRKFKKGEKAWVDPKTKRIVLASDCTNPVEKEIPPKVCAEIHYFTRPGDTVVRFALLGPKAVSNDCIGLRRAGEEDEFEHWWNDECKIRGCDFSEDARVVGQPVQMMGSYVPEPGEHILRLPALVTEKESLFRVVLCLERGDPGPPPYAEERPSSDMDPTTYQIAYGKYMAYLEKYTEWRNTWISMHSDGIGVRWFDYQTRKQSGSKTAIVWYAKEEIPPGEPELYWPWGVWAN